MAAATRSKTILVLVLSGLSVCLGLLNLADRSRWRTATDGINWTETKRGVEVGSFQARFKGPRDRIRKGDLLVAVNGIPVGRIDDLTEIQDFLSESLPSGAPANYEFQTLSGRQYQYPIQILREPSLHRGDSFLIVVAFAYLAIGLFIFLRNWKAQGAFHFYLICLVAFVLFLYRHSGRADSFDILIYGFNSAAFLLLPPLFLHFCCYFPRPLPLVRHWPGLKVLLYLPALFLGGIYGAWLLGWLQPFAFPRIEIYLQFLDQVHLVHFVIFFMLASLVLFRVRQRVGSPVDRQQLKWITYGTLLGVLPFVGLYAVPYLMGWPLSGWSESSTVALILIPLGFGYAITRYRLMDVDLIFKRSAAYLLASSALLGLYMMIVVLSGRAVQGLSDDSEFVLFALVALGVAFLFAPLKNRIQKHIDRHFYKESYDYRQSFADFGRTLNSEVKLEQLADKILGRIQMTLSLSPVAIFLREDRQGSTYTLYKARDLSPEGEPSVTIPDSVWADWRDRPCSFLPPGGSQDLQRAGRRLKELGLCRLEPLRAHEQVIGVLALGPHKGGRLPTSEDFQLVASLAGYAAIAIDNALLYQSLERNAARLAELKVYNENVVTSITVGVVVVSAGGVIQTWNAMMETIYDLPQSEVIGRDIEEVLPGALVATLKQMIEGSSWLVNGPGRLRKTHLRSRAGVRKMVDITVAPFLSPNDVNIGTLLVFDEVTEKVQLENQLLQAEKLSSIGLFAAGVAHEVNTPLAAISSYVQMLVKEASSDESRLELLKKVEQQSFRASSIVNNLLNFARISDTDLKEVNLNSVMVETLALLDHQMRGARVDVTMELDPSLPATWGNGGKLQQVFMNLFLNAKDAMPKGGELRVKTFYQDSSLVVKIKDTGHGIPLQDVKKIYDPFFTTKSGDKGTGLGLAVSYGIIQEHSGRISVDTAPGRGTTFTLEFPVKRVN
ncbi:MAG: ATP-binding protein [Acidobacteriota bacterium]